MTIENPRDLAEEFNARAKAEGRYLDKDFWDIPRQPGSVFDIPETEKSKADLAWFRARRLERQRAVADEVEDVRVRTHAIVPLNAPPSAAEA